MGGGCDTPPIPPPDDVIDPYAHLKLDTFDCPVPTGTHGPHGPRTPANWHGKQKLSPDGTKLVFLAGGGTALRVVDIRSGVQQQIDVTGRLTNVFVSKFNAVQWCPYDNNRLLVHCLTNTDTNSDGRSDVGGTNAYIVTLTGTEIVRVTPGIFGPIASNFAFGIGPWLKGSSSGSDSIHMGGRGIYLPQHDRFVPDARRGFFVDTKSGRYFGFYRDPYIDTVRFVVDGQRLFLPLNVSSFDDASWSPDGKKLALTVLAESNPDSVMAGNLENIWAQIWIVDVDRYLREGLPVAPVQVINMQKRFCTYSLNGIDAEYISNRTLAVSMYRDNENASLLWEITDDGRMVRQLTSLP